MSFFQDPKFFHVGVVVIIFLASLLATYILFRVLKSTANIKNRGVQAGGAIAGFILVFLLLSNFYMKLTEGYNSKPTVKITGVISASNSPPSPVAGVRVRVCAPGNMPPERVLITNTDFVPVAAMQIISFECYAMSNPTGHDGKYVLNNVPADREFMFIFLKGARMITHRLEKVGSDEAIKDFHLKIR